MNSKYIGPERQIPARIHDEYQEIGKWGADELTGQPVFMGSRLVRRRFASMGPGVNAVLFQLIHRTAVFPWDKVGGYLDHEAERAEAIEQDMNDRRQRTVVWR